MESQHELHTISDEDLVRRIVKSNDTLLFAILYDRYALVVYNKCISFAKDEEEAKDLAQDVFLKLFVKLASFKGKSKFSTWLYAFTYNHCVNYANRNTAKKIKQQSVEVEVADTVEDVEGNESDFQEMKVEKLKEALNLVSSEEKMILLMKYQDGMSIKEIKMRIKRAKDKLIEVYSSRL